MRYCERWFAFPNRRASASHVPRALLEPNRQKWVSGQTASYPVAGSPINISPSTMTSCKDCDCGAERAVRI